MYRSLNVLCTTLAVLTRPLPVAGGNEHKNASILMLELDIHNALQGGSNNGLSALMNRTNDKDKGHSEACLTFYTKSRKEVGCFIMQDSRHNNRYDACRSHTMSITLDSSGASNDGHGIPQTDCGTSSVINPTSVLVATKIGSVSESALESDSKNGFQSPIAHPLA